MTRKKGGYSHEEQGASKSMRRLGAVLTFVAVSVLVIAVGYYVGQVVMERFFTDSFGPTPGTPVATQSGTSANTPALTDPGQHNVAADTTTPQSPVTDTANDPQLPGGQRDVTGQTPPAGTPAGQGAVTEPGNTNVGTPSVPPDASSSTAPPTTSPSGTPSGDATSPTTPPASSTPPATPPAGTTSSQGGQLWHRVQVGDFASRADAEALLVRLRADYPDAYIVAGNVFRIQIGSFNSRAGADEAVAALRALGYSDVHLSSVEL